MKSFVLAIVLVSCTLASASSPIGKILQPRFSTQHVNAPGACKSILSGSGCPASFRVADSWPAAPGQRGGSARRTVTSRCDVFSKTHTLNTLFLTREVNEDTMGKYVSAGYIGARGLVDASSGKIDLKKGGGCYIYTRLVSTKSSAVVGQGSTGSGSPIMILFGPELLARADTWAASIDGMGCPPFRVCSAYKNIRACKAALMSTLTKNNVDECQDKTPGQDGDNWGGGKYYAATVDGIAKDNPSINEQGIFGSIPFDYVKAIIMKFSTDDADTIRSKLGMTASKYNHIIFKSLGGHKGTLYVKDILSSTEQATVCGFTA